MDRNNAQVAEMEDARATITVASRQLVVCQDVTLSSQMRVQHV
jgi:hypothetical protein